MSIKIKDIFFHPRKPVIVVSGLPRSGTSMMMKILEAGGILPVTDNQRMADEDNPKGYYELERVKQLTQGDIAWVDEAQGKVVKVISALLEHLPAKFQYKIIFMRREMAEILASQKQMLIRRGEPTDTVDDGTMAEMFQEHLKRVRVWLANQPNMQVHYVDYNGLMKDPAPHITALCDFLDMPLDRAAMLAVPDASLYRQKAAK
jgi:hypothetical protein